MGVLGMIVALGLTYAQKILKPLKKLALRVPPFSGEPVRCS
ncbi:hypothetical protein GXM_02260 [Nostoc sphaeroides CCNUC1]|uniref:Uncharacterized protein n=1 Tax=Nostoc sphaeroides CCNUC1 TaxID=2653204 RepID=A0A5P8VWJ7_9NOSO|nr:hypothetical protein GXM_02260 [Nostoc sphaeroides CCNUC1]